MKNGLVLFVDDEPAILEGITSILRKEPYAVATAGSGKDALALMAARPVDVIVSDEEMPEMLGSELLSRVAALYPRTIRVVLTGRGSLEAAVRCINHGGVHRYLTKPCAPATLIDTLRDALATKRLADENAEILDEARRNRAALLERARALVAAEPASIPKS